MGFFQQKGHLLSLCFYVCLISAWKVAGRLYIKKCDGSHRTYSGVQNSEQNLNHHLELKKMGLNGAVLKEIYISPIISIKLLCFFPGHILGKYMEMIW